MVSEQITTRRDGYELTPLKALDEVLGEQFTKGEIAGMRTVLATPDTAIETLTETIEALMTEEEDNG